MLSDAELMDIVVKCIAETADVEVEEVVPSALLAADLGMESLDFLDLSFRLEKRLGMKVQFDKAIPPEQLKLDEQGRLTEETVTLIGAQFPGMDGEKLRATAWPVVLQQVLSVEVVFNFVRQKLAQAGQQALAT